MSIDQNLHGLTSASAVPGAVIADLLAQAGQVLPIDRAAARRLVIQVVEILDTVSDNQPVSGLAPWQIRKIDDLIEERISRSITLDKLAAAVRLSSSHFGRAFKISFGETPHSYILRRRIALARKLMLETQASLAEIALDCGMSDQSHLTRVFKRFTGMSPNAWRRSMTEA